MVEDNKETESKDASGAEKATKAKSAKVKATKVKAIKAKGTKAKDTKAKGTKAKGNGTAKKRNGKKIPELNPEQAEFVEGMVKSLGSLEAVEKFYNLDDNVSKYALIKAKALFA